MVHSTAADSTSEATGSIHSGPPSGHHRAGADDDHRPGEVGEEVQSSGAHGDRLGTVVVADEQHAATVDDDRQETDDHHGHAVDGFRIDQTADRFDHDPRHRAEQQQRRDEAAERVGLAETERPRRRRRATGDPDGDDGGDQADRVDGLMRGVGEHHDRADGQADHDLHDGETDVDRGGAREPTRARLAVLMRDRRADDRVLVAAVILIH